MLKSSSKLLSLSLVSLLLPACGGAPAPEAATAAADEKVPGTVSYCHDGDTCTVKKDEGGTMTVRLVGIDAPETSGGDDGHGQPLGQDAKSLLNELVKGKHVVVRAVTIDMYDRTIGEVFLGQKVVNVEMLKAGLAETYIWGNDGIDAQSYRNAQKTAKTEDKGVWSLADYESPSDFRKRMKEEQ